MLLQHARLRLRRNTTMWRRRRMRGVNKNVHLLQPCCQMEIFSEPSSGPQWTQRSKSRLPQFAATVDRSSGWDTNRRRPGITRACGLSPAKVTHTRARTHAHTHTATGSCNREISGYSASERQMQSLATCPLYLRLSQACICIMQANFGSIWSACGQYDSQYTEGKVNEHTHVCV